MTPKCDAAVGLDVGGANLKAVHSQGAVRLVPYPLWKNPLGLAEALRALLETFDPFDRIGVTMTGELCDCYASKREGVDAILDAVQAIAGNRGVQVWTTEQGLVPIERARTVPLQVAAANWHALATFAGRMLPAGLALLLDIGSTTTDVIPIFDGVAASIGLTDPERLKSGELVYTGVRRTPLCALDLGAVAAEFFATTRDAHLVLGHVSDDPDDCDTADGRPATRAHAEARLARMLGTDLETSTKAERMELATLAVRKQVSLIVAAVSRVLERFPIPVTDILLAGSGEFLAKIVVESTNVLRSARCLSLSRRWGERASQAACAFALAQLALEVET